MKDARQWNQFEIIADHGHLQLIQNGQSISTQLWDAAWRQLVAQSKFAKWPDFGTFHSGHISLQGSEKKGDDGIKLYFRNIKIKHCELSGISLVWSAGVTRGSLRQAS